MQTSRSDKRQQVIAPVCALLLLSVVTAIPSAPASSVLWTAPSMLAAAMLIAWAAESAQFFMSQGFALAILAWWQTLPEFAVEAVLAWRQQTPLLLANLTGALRLLTGLGWPMIYCVAAFFHRRKNGQPLRVIQLESAHSVQVVALFASILYPFVIWLKRSLTVWDAIILTAIYAAYLIVLQRMPAEGEESIDDLEAIPRAIVTAPRIPRIAAITALFLVGGALIYLIAEPFLASLLALSTVVGVPNFVFIQWVAPFVSEFPEKVSAFYWARKVKGASTALMNMVSSNINQWTLLAAMLPVTFSISRGAISSIPFNDAQELEILMTLGQALLGLIFLVDMKVAWWEATGIFVLWFTQFAFSAAPTNAPTLIFIAGHVHVWVTWVYFLWAGVELLRMAAGRRRLEAFYQFAAIWREHIRPLR
jgi:cation:H+ antiporter